MRKTLRMLISERFRRFSSGLASVNQSEDLFSLARAVGMPPRYLPSAFALAMPSNCRDNMMLRSNSAIEPMI